ncbi:hypothetical protein LZC95_45440 [Pendulispora brunnea]|uniref:Uncharacterized protein n=1 Tax=Pendulispora brunnea TaxID=2905690 RepID=A0ABZ2K4Q7_9BACT
MPTHFRSMPARSHSPVAQDIDADLTTRMPEKRNPHEPLHRVGGYDGNESMTALYPGALPLPSPDVAASRRLEATVKLSRSTFRRALTRRIHVPAIARTAALLALCILSGLVIVLLRGGAVRESRIPSTPPPAPQEDVRPAMPANPAPAAIAPASLTADAPAPKPAKPSRHSSRHKKRAPSPAVE